MGGFFDAFFGARGRGLGRGGWTHPYAPYNLFVECSVEAPVRVLEGGGMRYMRNGGRSHVYRSWYGSHCSARHHGLLVRVGADACPMEVVPSRKHISKQSHSSELTERFPGEVSNTGS